MELPITFCLMRNSSAILDRITGPPWPPARRDMSLRLGERDSFVYIDRAYTLKLNFLSIEYW